MASRSKLDDLSPDHIPSYAAIRAKKQAEKGAPLTAAEERQLRGETNTLVIDTDIHQGASVTFGGRNSQSQIAEDALDLEAALTRDMEALRPGLLDRGYPEQQINEAFEKLHELNRAMGLY